MGKMGAVVWCDGTMAGQELSVGYRGKSFRKIGKVEKISGAGWVAWNARGAYYTAIGTASTEAKAKLLVEAYTRVKK